VRGIDLSKDVKVQQEALADYNTCLDKVGSQTPVYSIKEERDALKTRNEQQRKRVDEVLTERLGLESKTKQSEIKVTQMQSAMEERFNAMPPSQRQQYQDLLSEQQALQVGRVNAFD
jgi:intraflagellar transport protein 74